MRRRQGKIIVLSAMPILLSLSQVGKGSKANQIGVLLLITNGVGQQDRRRGLHWLGVHYLDRRKDLD